MRAVFLDYGSVSREDLDPSALTHVVPDTTFYASTTTHELESRIASADVVLLNKCLLDRAHLSAAQRLKFIGITATGCDNVDLAAARDLGIAVCNVQAYCTSSVTQQVWALVLSLTQRLDAHAKFVETGAWVRGDAPQSNLAIRELDGRVFGVVGWGELGQAVALIASAFKMRVLIANRPGVEPRAGRMHLDDLLRQADVVSLHCPLTPQTRGLIGRRELALMKSDALLINTARGGLVDAEALAVALKTHRLGGAGIDVLTQEPPIDGNALVQPGIPNLIVTPHVAWAAREARQRCLDDLAASLRDFRSGGRRARVV